MGSLTRGVSLQGQGVRGGEGLQPPLKGGRCPNPFAALCFPLQPRFVSKVANHRLGRDQARAGEDFQLATLATNRPASSPSSFTPPAALAQLPRAKPQARSSSRSVQAAQIYSREMGTELCALVSPCRQTASSSPASWHAEPWWVYFMRCLPHSNHGSAPGPVRGAAPIPVCCGRGCDPKTVCD